MPMEAKTHFFPRIMDLTRQILMINHFVDFIEVSPTPPMSNHTLSHLERTMMGEGMQT